jgi:hypothetical protein
MLAKDVNYRLYIGFAEQGRDIANVLHKPGHLANDCSFNVAADLAKISATKWRSNHNKDRLDMGIGSTKRTRKPQIAV